MLLNLASRMLNLIDRTIDVLSGLSMLLITAIVFLNAIGRYFLSFTLFGAEEASRLLMVYVCFLGTYTLLRRDGHVSVDVAMLLAPRALQRLMRGMIGVLIVAIMGFLAWYAWELVAFSAGTGQRSTTLPVPRYFFFLPAALGATFGVISGVETVIRAVTDTLPPLPNVLAPETDAGVAAPTPSTAINSDGKV